MKGISLIALLSQSTNAMKHWATHQKKHFENMICDMRLPMLPIYTQNTILCSAHVSYIRHLIPLRIHIQQHDQTLYMNEWINNSTADAYIKNSIKMSQAKGIQYPPPTILSTLTSPNSHFSRPTFPLYSAIGGTAFNTLNISFGAICALCKLLTWLPFFNLWSPRASFQLSVSSIRKTYFLPSASRTEARRMCRFFAGCLPVCIGVTC